MTTYTEVDCDIVYATDRAVLVRLAGESQSWIPRSQIEDEDEIVVGDRDLDDQTLMVSVWFAEKEGLV